MRISDWSSDVCSSDLRGPADVDARRQERWRRRLWEVACGPTWASPAHALGSWLTSALHQVGPALLAPPIAVAADVDDPAVVQGRKRVVSGKSVAVRVGLGGRRLIKKKKQRTTK